MLIPVATAALALGTAPSHHGHGRVRETRRAEDEETLFHDRLTGRAPPCRVVTDLELLLRLACRPIARCRAPMVGFTYAAPAHYG